MIDFDFPKKIEKDWGYELIIHNDDLYCGKILFIKRGNCISLQFHEKKTETFYLHSGELLCKFCSKEKFICPEDIDPVKMIPGDKKEIPVGLIHQVFALQDSTIIEFSTQHFDEDTIRISKEFKTKVNNDKIF